VGYDGHPPIIEHPRTGEFLDLRRLVLRAFRGAGYPERAVWGSFLARSRVVGLVPSRLHPCVLTCWSG
jgi:hypothetical protein